MPEFRVGDRVTKPSGYPYPGIVVGVITTTAGETRIVVESTELNPMLHIFAPHQLELATPRDKCKLRIRRFRSAYLEDSLVFQCVLTEHTFRHRDDGFGRFYCNATQLYEVMTSQ